ncbi:MAG: sulfatase-like hydrolase/transferase, partial [Bacteroidales bacterium]|nr:sulfatase-like hydrolase/transferase [Bacteroidales bacterium]
MRKKIFNWTLMFTLMLTLPNISAADAPNIVIIMVDDMGYSDAGCYGGEINTPNLDSLADQGLRFTQFYNASRCCPTRASMLTGLYPHQVGLTKNGQSLTTNCVTIAEALKTAGYNTGMTGKWHLSRTQALPNLTDQLEWLANRTDRSEFAPLETYPCNRGFDEHWGIIWGVVNFFDPFSLVHNEERIETVPDDFYITDFITDKSVDLIDTFSKKTEPFFLYVAHAAPHWPLHALPEDIAKYEGKYDYGWDSLRIKRYNRMVSMGLIDPAKVPIANNESNRNWNSETNKEWEANHMEVHAAMIDRVDQGIGKIIQKLKETGEYDNTIIFFLSDNGASPERSNKPGFDRPGYTRDSVKIKNKGDGYTAPGPETTWAGIGNAWAGASNTPFRYWKKESFHGGNCTPFIVHWPVGLKTTPGHITDYVGHVKDIMPTCMDLAGA